MPTRRDAALTACVDVGSTWTKAALVERGTGRLLATRQAPTTPDDVVAGVLAATAGWGAPVRACSSAGGGLRLAVVGYEELISAEAGSRAALSAGARVVHVAAGRLDDAALAALQRATPDVVLLVGGTDGGDATVLRANARVLAGARWPVPVVLAGNAAVRDEVAAELRAGGVPVTETANVLPDIGELDPEPARAAIREVFLVHVIGGNRLSADPRLRSWVRAVTPDAALEGVAVSAGALRAAAAAEGLAAPGDDPLALAEAAAVVALRRHLRAEDGRGPGAAGARTVGLVVLSGGVFRHGDPAAVDAVVARGAADRGGAGGVLTGTPVTLDRRYVLAAAGLLAGDDPAAAAGLLAELAGR